MDDRTELRIIGDPQVFAMQCFPKHHPLGPYGRCLIWIGGNEFGHGGQFGEDHFFGFIYRALRKVVSPTKGLDTTIDREVARILDGDGGEYQIVDGEIFDGYDIFAFRLQGVVTILWRDGSAKTEPYCNVSICVEDYDAMLDEAQQFIASLREGRETVY